MRKQSLKQLFICYYFIRNQRSRNEGKEKWGGETGWIWECLAKPTTIFIKGNWLLVPLGPYSGRMHEQMCFRKAHGGTRRIYLQVLVSYWPKIWLMEFYLPLFLGYKCMAPTRPKYIMPLHQKKTLGRRQEVRSASKSQVVWDGSDVGIHTELLSTDVVLGQNRWPKATLKEYRRGVWHTFHIWNCHLFSLVTLNCYSDQLFQRMFCILNCQMAFCEVI